MNMAGGPLTKRWFMGVEFTPMPMDEAVDRIVSRDPNAPFDFVTTPNAQHVVAVWKGDTRFPSFQRSAWLVLNDSSILRHLSRHLFGQELDMVAGSDLTVELFKGSIKPEDSLTVLGGEEEMVRRLREQFGMRQVAHLNPPMGFIRQPAEVDRCVEFVRANPARYIFIAMGAPQSDMLALRIKQDGGATGIGLCIGSSLNFVTGVVKRAPMFYRRYSLEWLHRLALNPRGHARRVFIESAPILAIGAKLRFARDQERAHRGPAA
jgi:N-acetylglucosaminyldiphosphoundecaprenol N-acetyl-beta-D-mannosaminyltransferase